MRSHHLVPSLGKGPFVVLLLVVVIIVSSAYDPDPVAATLYPLEYPANFGNRIIVPEDNPTTRPGVYLGRLLFYETALSANNRFSCGSCHRQELAFADGMALSRGVDGTLTTRNSMSLANLLWARKFFWDGRSQGLEEQAAIPLTNPHEMGQSLEISAKKLSGKKEYRGLFKAAFGNPQITPGGIVRAIAQFERTLISADSRYDRYLRKAYQPTVQELRGMDLFNQVPLPGRSIRGANCARCHGGVKTYMELFHNNGLDSLSKDEGIAALTGLSGDRGRFKVPTLRNIALTAPYMHDGRFTTLEEVIDHYSDHVKESASLSPALRGESNETGGKTLQLNPQEKKDVIAFLAMLTDSTFVRDPRFSDPHLVSSKPKLKNARK